ncbi:hypothetical protein BH10ACI1_BH10ACI1_13830 [soil metagenome]
MLKLDFETGKLIFFQSLTNIVCAEIISLKLRIIIVFPT